MHALAPNDLTKTCTAFSCQSIILIRGQDSLQPHLAGLPRNSEIRAL